MVGIQRLAVLDLKVREDRSVGKFFVRGALAFTSLQRLCMDGDIFEVFFDEIVERAFGGIGPTLPSSSAFGRLTSLKITESQVNIGTCDVSDFIAALARTTPLLKKLQLPLFSKAEDKSRIYEGLCKLSCLETISVPNIAFTSLSWAPLRALPSLRRLCVRFYLDYGTTNSNYFQEAASKKLLFVPVSVLYREETVGIVVGDKSDAALIMAETPEHILRNLDFYQRQGVKSLPPRQVRAFFDNKSKKSMATMLPVIRHPIVAATLALPCSFGLYLMHKLVRDRPLDVAEILEAFCGPSATKRAFSSFPLDRFNKNFSLRSPWPNLKVMKFWPISCLAWRRSQRKILRSCCAIAIFLGR